MVPTGRGRAAKWRAQGHRVGKWRSWASSPPFCRQSLQSGERFLLPFLARTFPLTFQYRCCIWHSDRLPSGSPGNILENTQSSSLERSPNWAGSARPYGPLLAHTLPVGIATYWWGFQGEATRCKELLSQGSQQAPHLHSLPLLAPYLPAVPEYLVFPEEAKLLLHPLPQYSASLPGMSFLPPCPQANSWSSFKTQLKSHRLHEAFSDLPQANWTALPLSSLSVSYSRGIRQVGLESAELDSHISSSTSKLCDLSQLLKLPKLWFSHL